MRAFYTKVLNEEERTRLCQNIAGHLKDAQLFIQKKAVSDALEVKGCHLLAQEENAASLMSPFFFFFKFLAIETLKIRMNPPN